MKQTVFLVLCSILWGVLPLRLQAQVDVTATYLTNPSFESGPIFFHDPKSVIPGWTITQENMSVAFLSQNDTVPAIDGLNVFGVWSPSGIADMDIAQTVKNLPAGTYSIRCVMTVPYGSYSTQRLFVQTSVESKSLYYGASSLAVVAGESPTFAGFSDDGNGEGPFHPLSINIRVNAGDSLVFGIRSNGKSSSFCPSSTLTDHGMFKVDNFRLFFIADEVAYLKKKIQDNVNLLNTFPKDSIPWGYSGLIQARIADAVRVVSNLSIADSLDCFNVELLGFIKILGVAKDKYKALLQLMLNAENLTKQTDYSSRESLIAALADTRNVFYSTSSLILEFDLAYSKLDEAIHSYIDGPVKVNLALSAAVSTSFVSSWEKLSAVNDGFEPISSTDRSHMVYGNWNGDGEYGKTNWIQYEWPINVTLNSASVYWFTDFGGLAPPDAATIEYWKDGVWKTVGAMDTALNHWNTLEIGQISSKKIRVSFKSVTSTGILEFKVMGFKKIYDETGVCLSMISDEMDLVNALPINELPKGYLSQIATIKLQAKTILIDSDSLSDLVRFEARLSDFRLLLYSAHDAWKGLTIWADSAQELINHTSLPNKDLLLKAYENAITVRDDGTSLLADFNTAKRALENAVVSYTYLYSSRNLALEAAVSTSYVSPWENLSAVNDGLMPISSNNNTQKKYGNWHGDLDYGKTNWVQYAWTSAVEIKNVSVYWFTDMGGMMMPDTAYVEYWSGSVWKLAGHIGVAADTFNTLPMVIKTSKLRLSMKSITATGILEFMVMSNAQPTPVVQSFEISTSSFNVAAGKEFLFPLKTSRINASDSIVSYQMDVAYDASKLAYLGFSNENTLSKMGVVMVNHTQDGLLKIGCMSKEFLVGSGALLNLKFKAIHTGETTPIVSNFVYNIKAITKISNGSIHIISLLGDVDGNDLVQAYDGAMVLQYSVGSNPMASVDAFPWSDWRMVAADVDDDDSVTAYDAGLILKHAIALIDVFPVKQSAALRSTDAATPNVTITKEGSNLVFRSYGDLIGLNVKANPTVQALGQPNFVNAEWMNATNISATNFKIGLATAIAPEDGSILMTLPIHKTTVTEMTFNLVINNIENDVRINMVTGVTSEEKELVNAYPNPVTDRLTVCIGSLENCTIQMINVLGQVVFKGQANTETTDINMSTFAGSGLYFLQVLDDQNRLITSKRILKK